MSEQNKAADKTADEKAKADAEAKKKADANAKAKLESEAKEKAAEKAKKPKQVRVICDGTLGPKLLKAGDVTDDEEYVALLDSKRGRTLVEEVK